MPNYPNTNASTSFLQKCWETSIIKLQGPSKRTHKWKTETTPQEDFASCSRSFVDPSPCSSATCVEQAPLSQTQFFPLQMSPHAFCRVNSVELGDFRKGNIRLLFVPENKRAFCRYQTAIRYGELSAWLSQCSKRWGDNTQQRQASLLIAHRIFIDQTISYCLLYANKQQRQGNRAKEGWTRGSN